MTPVRSPDEGVERKAFTQVQKALIGCSIVFFLILATGTAWRLRPWVDEGWYGAPALTLATKGYMGTPCFVGNLWNLPHLDQRSYWIMPIYPLVAAAWFSIFPLTLHSMRVVSVLAGLGGILLWAYFFRRLTNNNVATVLFLLFASCDYVTVTAAGSARPDMLAFAFQAAAFASYMALRERNLNGAILLSQTFVVLSGMTHPNGGILSFTGQLCLTLYLDRARLRLSHAALAAVPYLAGAIGWGVYIVQDPQSFLAQYGFQTKDRLDGFLHPWRAIRREFVQRYIPQMGLGKHFARNIGPHFLKSLIFAAYVVAIGGALFIRELRRQPAVRLFVGLAGVFLIFYTFLEETKAQYYFVYLTTIYTGLLALFIRFLWERRSLPKPLIALGLALLLGVQAGGSLLRMRLNAWGEYQIVVNWLNAHTGPDDLIAGSHELGFLIGYNPRFVDDYEVGLHSGRQPDFVVMEEVYDDRMQMVQQKSPAEYLRLQQRLSEYRQVFRQGNYRILMRKDHLPIA